MNDRIGRLVSFIHRKAMSYHTKCLKGYGISSAEYPVLFQLNRKDGVTQDEIAVELGMDKGAITRILQSLLQKQMVERKKDGTDRRCNRIFLTALGRETKEPVRQAKDSWNNILTKNMTEQEKKELVRLLKRTIQNIQEDL